MMVAQLSKKMYFLTKYASSGSFLRFSRRHSKSRQHSRWAAFPGRFATALLGHLKG
jgi:hypothetical protein